MCHCKDSIDNIINGNVCRGARVSIPYFYFTLGESFANNDDCGNAEQFRIFELDARRHALTIIKNDLKAALFKS
jgi:hypothetical protein